MRSLWISFAVLLLAVACRSEATTNDPGSGSPTGTGDSFDAAAIRRVDATSDVPASARAVLENADTFEILSTETAPERGDGELTDTHVMRYPILGRATAETRKQQHQILDDLYAAFRENDSVAAACFNPRHAIVATRGEERVIVVICFECMSWKGLGPDGPFGGLLGKSAKDSFNAIWKKHGLELVK